MSRERHLVELVTEAGEPIGSSTVEEAHRAPGQMHRAFSVLLVDGAGRLLLQRRSAAKTRFPLRWGNSCCGHPAPGQPVTDAATQRLAEELGLDPVPLEEIGVHVYHAEDPATGRAEREYDHVLLGRVPADVALRLDPDEVAEVAWVDPDDLRTQLRTRPQDYAPWLAGVTDQLPVPRTP